MFNKLLADKNGDLSSKRVFGFICGALGFIMGISLFVIAIFYRIVSFNHAFDIFVVFMGSCTTTLFGTAFERKSK
jgi:hypothetical protein